MGTVDEQRRYQEAVAECEQRIAEDPTHFRGHLQLGALHYQIGKYVEALSAYDASARHYTDMYAGPKAFFMNLQLYELIQKEFPHLENHFSHIILRLIACYLEMFVKRDESLEEERETVTRWAAGRARAQDAVAALGKIAELHPDGLSSLALAEALLRTAEIDGAVERFAVASRLLVRHQGCPEDSSRSLVRLMFRRLLLVRFGALPETLIVRLNAAGMEQLNHWAQRLPAATSVDDLLGA